MIVNDLIPDAKRIFGECALPELYKHLNDAIELIVFKGDIDPLIGTLDICCSGTCVTLPREVETPLAVNIGGISTLARHQLFRFHYGGTGDCRVSCKWEWDDRGLTPIYQDIGPCPKKLIATIQYPEDENTELWVYGYDDENNPLRTETASGWVDGIQIPTVYGYSMPDPDAPCVSRITRVRKAETVGTVTLQTYDASPGSGIVLGRYEWDETDPQYRRIVLSRDCGWIRLAFRRRVLECRSLYDAVPCHSKLALKMAMMAIKWYNEGQIAMGQSYEATAARLLTERQAAGSPPTQQPIQGNNPEASPVHIPDEMD